MSPKFCAVWLLLLGSAFPALPQGQVVLNNRVPGAVIAPIYGPEPADARLAKHGNTSAGLPAGTQTYRGPLLAGPSFTAQLFGGPTNALAADLRPLLPTTTFRSAEVSGFILEPLSAVSVGDVPEGSPAQLQLRVWDNRQGTITDWLQVLADPSILRGESLPFISPPLGGSYRAPVNLEGLESFNLTLGAQPPSSIRINFQPGEAPVPSGYCSDTGLPYGARGNGLIYGWNVDHTAQAYWEPALNAPEPRYASWITMQAGPGSLWEIALTNGVYRVHLAAGSPLSWDGVYRIEVEGMLAVQGTPVFGNHWVEGSVVVAVRDGKLTVSSGAGSFANRLSFLEITRIDPPRLLTPASWTTNGLSLILLGAPSVKYDLETTPDWLSWSKLGAFAPVSGNAFAFCDPCNSPAGFYRAAIALAAPPLQVYSNAFETAPGPEWSATTTEQTPAGARRFLGRFGHTTVKLRLSNLPPHTKMQIGFDLFVLQSWNENSTTNGPDTWGLAVTGGPVLLTTTFHGPTTNTALRQAYPGPFPGMTFPACTGSAETATLGYSPDGDSVYRLSYTFAHSTNWVEFNFVGGTTEPLANESWGLDNVVVRVQDDPY